MVWALQQLVPWQRRFVVDTPPSANDSDYSRRPRRYCVESPVQTLHSRYVSSAAILVGTPDRCPPCHALLWVRCARLGLSLMCRSED